MRIFLTQLVLTILIFLTPLVLKASMFYESVDEHCPRKCNGDEAFCNGDCCADGEEERDPNSCGNTECGDILGEFTDESLEALVTNSQECSSSIIHFPNLTMEEARYWLSGVAEQCGHDAGFTVLDNHNCFSDCPSPPDTCAAMEALVSVGGCANDCELDAVQPSHSELGCEVSPGLDQILVSTMIPRTTLNQPPSLKF